MAGLISPQNAFDLVKALKEEISIPVDLHSHCTSGYGPDELPFCLPGRS